MRNTLLLLLLWPVLNSCNECGPQKEPQISMKLSGDSLRIKNIYALGALNQTIFQEQASPPNAGFWNFEFPLSLHADSTTYIFEFETRTDTLTIFYRREFYHKDGCGFVVDALEPGNSKKSQSTFEKVSVWSKKVQISKAPLSFDLFMNIQKNIPKIIKSKSKIMLKKWKWKKTYLSISWSWDFVISQINNCSSKPALAKYLPLGDQQTIDDGLLCPFKLILVFHVSL